MRKLHQTLVSILAVAAVGAGCNREEFTAPLNSSTVVNASINNSSWLPAGSLTATYTGGTITIDGVDSPDPNKIPPDDPRRLVLTVTGVSAVGSYNLGTGGAGVGQLIVGGTKTWSTAANGSSGNLNITLIGSNFIVGNFFFNAAAAGGGAVGTAGVTAGVFTIYF